VPIKTNSYSNNKTKTTMHLNVYVTLICKTTMCK